MNRRSVLKSLGATTIAGSAVLGSGALTQVTAQRNVTINVANDNASAVKMEAGTAADGEFATISQGLNGNTGQLGFETGDINAGGELIVGSANDNTSSNPKENYLTSSAFKITNNADLATDTAMGVTVSVSTDAASGLGLLFLPTGSAASSDLENTKATGGKGYGDDTRDSVAGINLVSADGDTEPYPSLPDRFDANNDGAKFLLQSSNVQTVGAELLLQADPSDVGSDPSFTITVTAETVDTS